MKLTLKQVCGCYPAKPSPVRVKILFPKVEYEKICSECKFSLEPIPNVEMPEMK